MMAINPRDGTDCLLGAMDHNRDGTKNEEESAGRRRLHMNLDKDFQWDTKDDSKDQDNGFVCKKPIE